MLLLPLLLPPQHPCRQVSSGNSGGKYSESFYGNEMTHSGALNASFHAQKLILNSEKTYCLPNPTGGII